MAAALSPAPGAGAVHPLFAEGPPPPCAPAYEDRFKTAIAKQVLSEVLKGRLSGAEYQPDAASAWAREIADEAKRRLKAEPWAARYKLVAQAFVGEQRGAGCTVAARCFWDEQADGYAQTTFSNESIFAVVVVFAFYMY